MDKQLKAIDWLLENMPDLGKYIPLGVSLELHAKFQQAKQLEKQQIINAVNYGMAEDVRERYSDKKLSLKPKGDAEQYYNNNFKQ